jgi:multiple sugar transport system substrate-binding protein
MPGSLEVLNRTSNQLVPCTQELCPYAEPVPAVAVKPATAATMAWLNRAPFAAGGGWVAAVNARTPSDYRNASITYFMHLAAADESWARVLDTTSRKH